MIQSAVALDLTSTELIERMRNRIAQKRELILRTAVVDGCPRCGHPILACGDDGTFQVVATVKVETDVRVSLAGHSVSGICYPRVCSICEVDWVKLQQRFFGKYV